MALFRKESDTAEIVDLLRRTEADAAEACRRAATLISGEPLTRGALLAFAAEHEDHRAALEAIAARLPRPSARSAPTGISTERMTSPGSALRVLRQHAELAVRRLGEAMTRVPDGLVPTIRGQRNVWLRHRAWLGARIDAFARSSVA